MPSRIIGRTGIRIRSTDCDCYERSRSRRRTNKTRLLCETRHLAKSELGNDFLAAAAFVAGVKRDEALCELDEAQQLKAMNTAAIKTGHSSFWRRQRLVRMPLSVAHQPLAISHSPLAISH
jgi:hypothetical protein